MPRSYRFNNARDLQEWVLSVTDDVNFERWRDENISRQQTTLAEAVDGVCLVARLDDGREPRSFQRPYVYVGNRRAFVFELDQATRHWLNADATCISAPNSREHRDAFARISYKGVVWSFAHIRPRH